jgi:hypothetical protein
VLVPNDSIQNMTVEVISTRVTIPDNDKQPLIYDENPKSHPEITAGKAGGH